MNEISLQGQFNNENDLKKVIIPLLHLRKSGALSNVRLFVSHSIKDRPVTPEYSFAQLVRVSGDRDFRNALLNWLGKDGPFWEEHRQANADDYFEHDGVDVTDSGLAEAARRQLGGLDSHTFSFSGGNHSFAFSPLVVTQGLSEEILNRCEIINYWRVEDLKDSMQQAIPFANWKNMLDKARTTLPNLIFSPNILDILAPHPWNLRVGQRVLELLIILNNIVNERKQDDSLTQNGLELRRNYFEGERAPFTDESDSNKRDFEKELTFSDPEAPGRPDLFCPWHGKIHTAHYRIHFQWPLPAGQRVMKIVYIGPKITKK
ncbi:MAG: hypothetical protein G8345_07555 [Magnetococcales bacterium]|nr:hypothetical protein [Magnetococcales bacterium]NGZ26730.1 hypothetical protein [Magnetococcales bacterium]